MGSVGGEAGQRRVRHSVSAQAFAVSAPPYLTLIMSAVDSQLAAILSVAGTPPEFKEWLEKEGLLDPAALGLLAPAEADIDAKIIEVAREPASLDTLAKKIAVKKAWLACRGVVDKRSNVAAGRVREEEDTPLDPELVKDLEAQWTARHRYALPGHRILVPGLFARRFREAAAIPKRFTILLPEAVRTRACVEKTSKAMMVPTAPGEAVTVEEIIADEVGSYHDLWTRIRADFSTMALVSIADTSHVDFQDVETFCDRILQFMHQRFDKKMAR